MPAPTYDPVAAAAVAAVARLIAEEVLDRGGVFLASNGHLRTLVRKRIPDSPAAKSPDAVRDYVRWARADLGTYGVAVRRETPTPGRKEWSFRLVAVPGEEAR